MAEAAVKKPGFFKRLGRFFKDLKNEMKKVIWPSRKQVVNNTGVVIVTVIGVGTIIWILDAIFRSGTGILSTF